MPHSPARPPLRALRRRPLGSVSECGAESGVVQGVAWPGAVWKEYRASFERRQRRQGAPWAAPGRRLRIPKRGLALGVAVLVAATAAGCGSGAPVQATLSGNETLTITTFGEFGYDDLIKTWNADPKSPFKVKQTKIKEWDTWREQLNRKLDAGSGLTDIVAVEGDSMPKFLTPKESARFVDLSDPKLAHRFVGYKYDAGRTNAGKQVGYPTDAGPEAMCYRADLFKKAGLASSRAKVTKYFSSWDTYFKTGALFVKRVPGSKWYDSSGSIAQAMLNQTRYPFQDRNGTVDLQNDGLRNVYGTVASHAATLSTGADLWSDQWTANFTDNGFATIPCPGWMFANIKKAAPKVKGWDIADAFPGGGGNWGGSYLAVPKQSAHQKEAKQFAAWLTDAEQEVAVFHAAGNYPANLAAQQELSDEGGTDAYFNDAPTAKILADRAQAVKPNLPYKGDKYSDILALLQSTIHEVDLSNPPSVAWTDFLDGVDLLN
ncbi:MAG: carbohydrate ABC transporter substrate-binding protein [Nocardioides sp.]|nr:carbohydrate ABC transporter substrate-binding protein [Nocardioides sp.]